MYIVDPVNSRIFRYPKGKMRPEEIKIDDSYSHPYESNMISWSNIGVSESNIYFVYQTRSGSKGTRKVAILSLNGLEESEIDLKPYYPLYSISRPPLMVDRFGGVYIFLEPVGMVHYSSKLLPEFKPLGIYFEYDNLTVGWDRNLYSYHNSTDILNNWGPSDRASIHDSFSQISGINASISQSMSSSIKILGVDKQGQLYFISYIEEKSASVVRVDPSKMEGEIGEVQEQWRRLHIQFSLAPDGALYGLAYDRDDFSIQPKIVRCSFE